ncbi:uncharacterized protein N7459_003798 [Penicillium hispanicum]|uniref:uncharacterized protein n=1 Tax=Penicillium hispanicum TaxID=1080232 RepID=UPI00254012F7|nr:uncharacterized protein N7459_003798 [Penicillium hispanicum]KAJ5583998.1 hypothetical protein N7459_003798 [Penicillium hispanicum]
MEMEMAEASNSSTAGWRIPKACQECRKRKIRCNGLNPCKTCQQRNTPCVYRDFIRHRRRKQEYQDARRDGQSRRGSPALTHPPGQRTSSVMREFPNSVTATHMASPSCQMQLYYGATSHFALMQHIYRALVANPAVHPEPSGEVEEAGAGLDLFSFRRIFFGTPDTHEGGKLPGMGNVMFLPLELAKVFLARYLSALYHMLPHRPKDDLGNWLEQLYSSTPFGQPDTLTQAILLLTLAIGSLGTEYHAWGDILFDQVKASLTSFDDVVNLQMPSQYASFQNEQGRPNSAFLHLGTSARKALSAGLHKDVPHDEVQAPGTIEERRITFWSLYVYETWFCFHIGRPSSLALRDVAIEDAQDPFTRLLAHLCKTISRSANEIYGQNHESLLHMWRVARSIANDLRGHEAHMKEALGFGLDGNIQTGSLGVRQTIFFTLYYHTMLLTFRPFLMFRGHWQRSMEVPHDATSGASKHPKEIPSWLNEACNHVLTAARKSIHHLYEASASNDYVKQLRYHGYFMGSSAFTLIFDLLHDTTTAAVHLPWVYASLHILSTMRAGDPITNTISAIQTVLRSINPSYEWTLYHSPADCHAMGTDNSRRPMSQSHGGMDSQQESFNGPTFSPSPFLGPRSNIPFSEWNLAHIEGPETGGSGGSNEDLLDFTQADMGWNFDFSTMDLEAFFSVYPSADSSFS